MPNYKTLKMATENKEKYTWVRYKAEEIDDTMRFFIFNYHDRYIIHKSKEFEVDPQDGFAIVNMMYDLIRSGWRQSLGGSSLNMLGKNTKVTETDIIITNATIMFVLMVVVNSYSPITGLICFICLIFLFFESAFGICLGCKFYSMVYKEKAQYCPGEICDVKSRQDIQKTSWVQLVIVFGFISFIVLTVFLFNDIFSVEPHNLFEVENSVHSE